MIVLAQEAMQATQSVWVILGLAVLTGSAMTALIQVLAARKRTQAEADKATNEGDASLVAAASQLFDTFGSQTMARIASLESKIMHLEEENRRLRELIIASGAIDLNLLDQPII